MKQFLFLSILLLLAAIANAQVGIGTSTPEFKLSLENDGGMLAKGSFGSGFVLTTSGAGTRLIWYPRKAAFRAGSVDASQWDDANVGNYSAAFGNSNMANGPQAFSAGNHNSAGGIAAATFGGSNFASGDYSFATGFGNLVSGNMAFARGNANTASGTLSNAIGFNDSASGNFSTVIGNNAVALNEGSVAIGSSVRAEGSHSFALGTFASTNGKNGSFVIGDTSSSTMVTNDANNQMAMRFAGGYKLYSDAAASQANVFHFNKGKLSIGTIIPEAKLTMDGDGGIVAKGTFGIGDTVVTSGAGSRMIWNPNKGAFRAGRVDNTQWDNGNIGYLSMAMGFNSVAFGPGSIALGGADSAIGTSSVAIGEECYAGENAVSLGKLARATGTNSIAIGNASFATGANSVALGRLTNTNGMSGSFCFGDGAIVLTNNDAINQMMMRFSGGYKLFTNSSLTTGVQIAAGGNSWATISDRRKKENFVAVNGEDFLRKIAAFKLTSWNYKGQDAKQYRHYGPMAQDFYAAFGKDSYGVIGNDTTISSADFDGVNLIAIQALEKRTQELQTENEALQARLNKLEALVEEKLTKK